VGNLDDVEVNCEEKLALHSELGGEWRSQAGKLWSL